MGEILVTFPVNFWSLKASSSLSWLKALEMAWAVSSMRSRSFSPVSSSSTTGGPPPSSPVVPCFMPWPPGRMPVFWISYWVRMALPFSVLKKSGSWNIPAMPALVLEVVELSSHIRRKNDIMAVTRSA